jgi:adenine phosphoribosyltransferase|tara:strand:+ start:9234 stop:9716 length:483 start_codon:yes stop_codon:yes gene_type:complete
MEFKSYIKDVLDFPKLGVTFKDIQPLLSNPIVYNNAIKEMNNLVETPDYWVGIDSRGFIMASALSLHTKIGLKLIRKKGKLPPPILSVSYNLEYGSDTIEMQPGKGNVVIIDDVYATGGTMDAAEKLCREAGYNVIDKLVLIDLCFLHPINNIKSLIKYE